MAESRKYWHNRIDVAQRQREFVKQMAEEVRLNGLIAANLAKVVLDE